MQVEVSVLYTETLWIKEVGLTWTQNLHQSYQNNNKKAKKMNYNDLLTLDKIN